MASANFSDVQKFQIEPSEPNTSDQTTSPDRDLGNCDSRNVSKQMLPCSEITEPCDHCLSDYVDMNSFSEEQLLNITFETCNTTERGEVLASSVVQYLQAMTGHGAGQDKLIVLWRMLDPEDRDPALSRDTFHTTMKKWIAQCNVESFASGSDSSKASGNGIKCFPLLAETTSRVEGECHCESADLLAMVADLRHAQYRLGGHNRSLLRTISQSEDTNLQLTLEISELRSKLTSAQLCADRVRGLAEDLDETRQALKESQERTSRAQANSHALMKETERLKGLIKVIEEKNERLVRERNCAEDQLTKLRSANTNYREEMQEMQVLLVSKENEISKKNITVQKLKETYLEYNRIIEGLQSDLMRLQEHSQQVVLRFDKHSVKKFGLKSGHVPNYCSLQQEIQEAQSELCHLKTEIPTTCASKRGFQKIINKITSAEFKQDAFTAKFVACQRQQDQTRDTRTKRIMTILKDLEQPQSVCEQHQEHRLTQTKEINGTVTWWKALRLEGERNCTKDMKERIRMLEAELMAAQMEVQKGKKEFHDRKDCAVQTESMKDISRDESEKHHTAAETVLESLRKVEVFVGKAFHAAEVLTLNERMIKRRMKMIGHKVEDAICRAALTEKQMSALEAKMTRPLSSDICALSDVDMGRPEVCKNWTHSERQTVSQSAGQKSSATKGVLFPGRL